MLGAFLGFFFNQFAEIDATVYTQDAAGARVGSPQLVAMLVPCCVQQDGPPEVTTNQGRTGSVQPVKVFFQPANPPSVQAIGALKAKDSLVVRGYPNRIILDGPPRDVSGRGVVWEAAGRDVR